MSYQVVTIGAATQDVFMISKNFAPIKQGGDLVNVLEYGSKIEVEDIVYDTGGGATNCATTFARQGLHVAAIVKIGVDSAGREILHILHKEGVVVDHVIKSHKAQTGFSVLLKPQDGDRTVLVHRGASDDINKNDLGLSAIKTEWLYVSSLAGEMKTWDTIVKWAERHNVFVAMNPGSRELAKPKQLLAVAKKAQIVSMNLDEAMTLTNTKSVRACLMALHQAGLHIVLVTDGAKGSYCLYNQEVYKCGLYKKVRVVDRTGAGDAYTAGFVSALIRGLTIEQAMSFAAANSTSVISYVGAKTGILKTHDFHNLKVKRAKL